jgi:hypothetical protein
MKEKWILYSQQRPVPILPQPRGRTPPHSSETNRLLEGEHEARVESWSHQIDETALHPFVGQKRIHLDH